MSVPATVAKPARTPRATTAARAEAATTSERYADPAAQHRRTVGTVGASRSMVVS